MALTTDDVLHIANLARLPLSQEEIERLQHQLSDVLQYFEQLQEVDTLETVPTSQTTGLTSVLGKDELNTFTVFSQEQALMNAPSTHNGFFVVKGVFQDEG